MRGMPFKEAAKRIALGYFGALRSFGWLLALLGGTLLASAIFVFPLWYVSTHHREAYTTGVLAVCAAGVLFLIVRKVRTLLLRPAKQRKAAIRRFFVRTIVVIAYFISFYIVLGFYLVGFYIAAVPLSLIYIIVLGHTLYVRRARQTRA